MIKLPTFTRKPASIDAMKAEYRRITALNVALRQSGRPINQQAVNAALACEQGLKAAGVPEFVITRLARAVYQDSGATMPDHLTTAY